MDNKSIWYICILLGSSLVTTASPYVATLLGTANGRFTAHFAAAAILYLASLTLLSLAASEHWRLANAPEKRGDDDDDDDDDGKRPPRAPLPLPGRAAAYPAARATGLLAGAYVLALPLLSPDGAPPVLRCGLRVATFFAACKCWDLTAARGAAARPPPVPLRGRGEALYGLARPRDHARYVWEILASTRYASFDIAVDKTGRRRSASAGAAPAPSRAWTHGPWLLLPAAYLFPAPELRALGGLAAISYGLELCHTVLHPGCPNPLFFQPFAAAMPSEFWSCHWHQTAQPFLYSLGFVPARTVFGRLFGREAGRAAGVLGAFSLSGVWHAWAAAVLTSPEYVWNQSVGLWGIFMLQGVLVIVERAAFRDDKWRRGWRQRILTAVFWMCSIESVSIWLRYAEPRAIVSLPWTASPPAWKLAIS